MIFRLNAKVALENKRPFLKVFPFRERNTRAESKVLSQFKAMQYMSQSLGHKTEAGCKDTKTILVLLYAFFLTVEGCLFNIKYLVVAAPDARRQKPPKMSSIRLMRSTSLTASSAKPDPVRLSTST